MQHSQKQASVHRAGAAAGAQPGTPHTAAESSGQCCLVGLGEAEGWLYPQP